MGDQNALAKLVIGELSVTEEKRGPAFAHDAQRRKQLRNYDPLPSQIFNPMGESGIEHLPDAALWDLMGKGNKGAACFSEICFPEAERRAVAISRFAEVYTVAINRFRQNKFSQMLIKESAYDRIITESEKVLGMLSKLNQAEQAKRQLNTIKNATYAKAGTGMTHSQAEVDAAVGELFEWLNTDSVLRAFMSYMTGAGSYFAASAQERGLCCFISAGSGDKEQLIQAMQARSSSSSSSPSKSKDDALALVCVRPSD